MNIIIAIGNVRIVYQVLEERQGGLDAIDYELIQCTAQTHHAFHAVAAMNDELADQAVIIWRDLVAGVDAGIDADTETTGRMVMGDFAWRRGERTRIFSINAAFDGMTGKADVVLGHRQAAT